MSKFRFFLSLVVILSSLVIASAHFLSGNSSSDNISNLLFINPIESNVDNISLNVLGEGNYQIENGATGKIVDLSLNFWNLRPGKNYVLWCMATDEDNNQPCQANDGRDLTVRSDADGNASLSASILAMPDDSTDTDLIIIALAYASENYTYGEAVKANTYIFTFATLALSAEGTI